MNKSHTPKKTNILNPPRMVFWDAISPSSFRGEFCWGSMFVRSFSGVSFDGGFEKTKLQIIDEVVVFLVGRGWE